MLIKTQSSSKHFSLALLTIELVLVSLSLFDTVLAWILLIVACSAVIRGAIFFNFHKHLPTIRTLNLLAILSALGLVYSGYSLDLLLAMVNLLVLACALKLMQVRSQKDIYQLVISLYFLIGCGFIFNQSLAYSLFYSLMSLTLLLSLACHHGPSIPLKAHLTTISRLSLQALPIGLLLFLVLPQLPPLWQTPKSKTMETGLSEQITPGDIANLSQSSELAFRATFNTKVPNYGDRYWRTIVMEEFDGRSWKVHPTRQKAFQLPNKVEFSAKLLGPTIDYEIMAEPTYQNWLFALDLAKPIGPSQSKIKQTDTFQLLSKQKLVSQFQYQVSSYPQALAAQTLTAIDKKLNLSLPSSTNPRTRIWIERLRKQYSNDQQFIQAVLEHFTANPFVYTLRPDVMYRDPVDQFLFDKQAGFCSHYASALAFSLRLGGIPARVVAGYQGGELTTGKGQTAYLSIYQYDAHAWVEIWQQTTGWQRIDPTALVSPDRINFGLREAMLEEGSFLADSPFSLARMSNIAWLNNIRLLLADLDYNWSRLVLGFNEQRQQDLFKSILGKITPDRLSLLGLGITAMIGLLLTLFFIPHWLNNRANKTQRYYQQALKLFAHTPYPRQNWQGPEAFAQQVSQLFPEPISSPVRQITQIYMRLTYQNINSTSIGQLTSKQCHRMMAKEIRKLKVELAKLP